MHGFVSFVSFTENSDAFVLRSNEGLQAFEVGFVEGFESVDLLLESRSGLFSSFGESLSGLGELKNNLVDDVPLEVSFFTVGDPGFSHSGSLGSDLLSLIEEGLSSLSPHSPLFDGLRVLAMLDAMVVANNMVLGMLLVGICNGMLVEHWLLGVLVSDVVLLVVHCLFGHNVTFDLGNQMTSDNDLLF